VIGKTETSILYHIEKRGCRLPYSKKMKPVPPIFLSLHEKTMFRFEKNERKRWDDSVIPPRSGRSNKLRPPAKIAKRFLRIDFIVIDFS